MIRHQLDVEEIDIRNFFSQPLATMAHNTAHAYASNLAHLHVTGPIEIHGYTCFDLRNDDPAYNLPSDVYFANIENNLIPVGFSRTWTSSADPNGNTASTVLFTEFALKFEHLGNALYASKIAQHEEQLGISDPILDNEIDLEAKLGSSEESKDYRVHFAKGIGVYLQKTDSLFQNGLPKRIQDQTFGFNVGYPLSAERQSATEAAQIEAALRDDNPSHAQANIDLLRHFEGRLPLPVQNANIEGRIGWLLLSQDRPADAPPQFRKVLAWYAPIDTYSFNAANGLAIADLPSSPDRSSDKKAVFKRNWGSFAGDLKSAWGLTKPASFATESDDAVHKQIQDDIAQMKLSSIDAERDLFGLHTELRDANRMVLAHELEKAAYSVRDIMPNVIDLPLIDMSRQYPNLAPGAVERLVAQYPRAVRLLPGVVSSLMHEYFDEQKFGKAAGCAAFIINGKCHNDAMDTNDYVQEALDTGAMAQIELGHRSLARQYVAKLNALYPNGPHNADLDAFAASEDKKTQTQSKHLWLVAGFTLLPVVVGSQYAVWWRRKQRFVVFRRP
jgi:hypothetical protein